MPEATATPNNPNPERRCGVCGVRTRSKSGICMGCSHTGGTWVEPTEADALTGGRWVSEGGIQRWRPWTEAECAERTRRALKIRPPSPEFVEAQEARRRLHLLVTASRPQEGAA